jgi:hypothetical protein
MSTSGAEVEVYYRYENHNVSLEVDPETGESHGHGVHVTLDEYLVLRHTPKGVWLDMGQMVGRFVRYDARKKFAHPTREEALSSFQERKRRQIKILSGRLRDARAALTIAWHTTTTDVDISDEAAFERELEASKEEHPYDAFFDNQR